MTIIVVTLITCTQKMKRIEAILFDHTSEIQEGFLSSLWIDEDFAVNAKQRLHAVLWANSIGPIRF